MKSSVWRLRAKTWCRGVSPRSRRTRRWARSRTPGDACLGSIQRRSERRRNQAARARSERAARNKKGSLRRGSLKRIPLERFDRLKSSLELVLQRKLDYSRIARRADETEIGRTNIAIGIKELRMIRQVEELCAEFKLLRFRHSGSLKDREVPVIDSRAVEHISSQSAKSARAQSRSCP